MNPVRGGAGEVFGGRVALVSGAAGAIGGAILEELRHRGATAIGLDTRVPAGDNHFIEADVADEEAVARGVNSIVADHGRLDILVHAAGISRDGVVWKLDRKDWDDVLRVNLTGAYVMLRHGVPALRAAGGGHIVLIGSINGSRGKFGLTAYAASKAGLLGLAKSAAKETGRFGIRVNVVEPGMVETPMTKHIPAAAKADADAEILLGRWAQTEDIALSVAYLCGPGGDHITGQVLRVDGGQYI